MSDEIIPAQIYLATPRAFDPREFAPRLQAVLELAPVVCVRLSLASTEERELTRAADTLREVCHNADVAFVVDDHFRMVQPLGLDGVHLTDGSRHVREAREMLGQDAIVGAYCEGSRHAGMTAAEIGTDYISFGPIADTGTLGSGAVAETELFRWWSQMIEVPLVAEGNATLEGVKGIKDYIDFLTLGDEIWNAEDGAEAAVKRFMQALE